jgi:hypothetical protein
MIRVEDGVHEPSVHVGANKGKGADSGGSGMQKGEKEKCSTGATEPAFY